MTTQDSAQDIVVVGACDQGYAPYLTVTFCSLIRNTANPSRLCLYCINGGISPDTMAEMASRMANLGVRFSFLEEKRDLYSDAETSKHISAAAYLRISIPHLLDSSIKRAIYLDCDTIVLRDISELWEVDMEGLPLAAVENISSKAYITSGLPQSDYFNSGVLLMDLDIWRRQKLAESVRAFIQEHPEKIQYHDQCALNGVIAGRWKRLPLSWNHQSGIYKNRKQLATFAPDVLLTARLSPAIVHFVGSEKPWNDICLHPFTHRYHEYAQQAGFDYIRPSLAKRLSFLMKSFANIKRLLRRQLWSRRINKYATGLNKPTTG